MSSRVCPPQPGVKGWLTVSAQRLSWLVPLRCLPRFPPNLHATPNHTSQIDRLYGAAYPFLPMAVHL